MIKKFGLPILTLFGVGYFKYVPGTAASFITCIIYYILWIAEFSLHNHKIYLVCFLIIILIYSISIIDKLKKSNLCIMDVYTPKIMLTINTISITFKIPSLFISPMVHSSPPPIVCDPK